MKKLEKILVIGVTSVLFFSGMLGVSADAGNGGEPGGLTPGFWKNHLAAWELTGIEPEDEVGDLFIVPFSDLASSSLLDALSFKGGRGTEGAARILLRQAVAALLNEYYPEFEYPLYDIVDLVNNALASNDRDTMLSLKGMLDTYNNLGWDDE